MQPGLVRGLGQLDATMIVVGILIGSGIFIVSAESARLVGAPGWLLAAWMLAGLMTIAGAQCCAELAAMMPHAGGPYVYLREAYGPAVGFLFGWTLSVVVHTGKIAAVAVAFASFTGVLVSWVSPNHFLFQPVVLGRYALTLSSQQLVAVLSILVLTIVNARGLEAGEEAERACGDGEVAHEPSGVAKDRITSTSARTASSASSARMDSAGLWLIPPAHRTNIIPIGQRLAIAVPSCPAPLGKWCGRSPRPAIARSIRRAIPGSQGTASVA